MLSNLLGIRLVFWLGDTVPLPAPYEALLALQRVEVTHDSDKGDGFQIIFNLARNGIPDYGLLQSGTLAPMKRVVLGVVFGALPEVLINGVITHHQVNPGTEPGQATLTVTGRDLTTLFDLEEKNEEFPNQSDFMMATSVLAHYAKDGVVPVVEPTTNFPPVFERIPRQHETDLEFLQRLALRNSFVFYLEPITFGVTQAYFGPENRRGLPQPALSMHLGAATNVKSLTFAHDALALVSVRGVFIEPFSKMSLAIPPLPPLKVPPLAARPAPSHRIQLQRETANQTPATAALRSLASTTTAPEPVTADGEVDGARYGHALRARRLVGVRGAGLTHDGFWKVKRVTHAIARGGYTQRFQLEREGTHSLTPVVIP